MLQRLPVRLSASSAESPEVEPLAPPVLLSVPFAVFGPNRDEKNSCFR
jgi:hypothetical protein